MQSSGTWLALEGGTFRPIPHSLSASLCASLSTSLSGPHPHADALRVRVRECVVIINDKKRLADLCVYVTYLGQRLTLALSLSLGTCVRAGA
jgi:hypothetical protein